MTKFEKIAEYVKGSNIEYRVAGWIAKQAIAELQYDFSRLGVDLPKEDIKELMRFVTFLTEINEEENE